MSQSEADTPVEQETKKTPENLDSMIRNHVGRQVDRVFVCVNQYDMYLTIIIINNNNNTV